MFFIETLKKRRQEEKESQAFKMEMWSLSSMECNYIKNSEGDFVSAFRLIIIMYGHQLKSGSKYPPRIKFIEERINHFTSRLEEQEWYAWAEEEAKKGVDQRVLISQRPKWDHYASLGIH